MYAIFAKNDLNAQDYACSLEIRTGPPTDFCKVSTVQIHERCAPCSYRSNPGRLQDAVEVLCHSPITMRSSDAVETVAFRAIDLQLDTSVFFISEQPEDKHIGEPVIDQILLCVRKSLCSLPFVVVYSPRISLIFSALRSTVLQAIHARQIWLHNRVASHQEVKSQPCYYS